VPRKRSKITAIPLAQHPEKRQPKLLLPRLMLKLLLT
jgi:hypothetical protein